jgi:type III secretory pathway component EscS
MGCHAGNWVECVVKSLTLFGFVMGVPVVVVSALVGMLLDEIFAA